MCLCSLLFDMHTKQFSLSSLDIVVNAPIGSDKNIDVIFSLCDKWLLLTSALVLKVGEENQFLREDEQT